MEQQQRHSSDSNEQTTPGERLAMARRQQGLTPSDIAQALNLSPHFIGLIEQDEWQSLPALVYLKGYVRNYAHFLKLDASELIALMERYINQHNLYPKWEGVKTPISPLNGAKQGVSVRRQYSAKKKRKSKRLLWLLSACLISLLTLITVNHWNESNSSTLLDKPSKEIQFNSTENAT